MNWFFKKGDLSQDGWDVLVDSSIEGWQHTGLKVGTLREGHSFHLKADGVERIIFPLEGRGLTVEYREAGEPDFKSQFLNGRESVFHGTADLVYVPLDTEVKIWGDGRVAIGEALAKNVKTKIVKFQVRPAHIIRYLGGVLALSCYCSILIEIPWLGSHNLLKVTENNFKFP